MVLNTIDLSELPSRGKGYKVDLIEVRGLNHNEIKLLAMTDIIHLEDVLNNLFVNNNIINNMSFNDIYDMDKYVIYYKVREITFTTADYKISYECPNCGNISNFVLDTAQDLSINFWDGNNIEIPVEVKNEDPETENLKYSIKLRPSKIGDRKAKHRIQGYDNIDVEKAEISACVTNINIQETYELINGENVDGKGVLPPLALAYVFTSYGKLNNGLGFKPYVNDKSCTSCGGDVTNIPFSMAFFNFIPTL